MAARRRIALRQEVMLLQQYTLLTGHCRLSDPTGVPDRVLAVLKPLLRTGTYQVPGMPGYACSVTVDGDALAATVWTPNGAPLTTTIICPSVAALELALSVLQQDTTVPLRPPCAIVTIHPTIVLEEAPQWLGDFEHGMACAWLKRHASLHASGSDDVRGTTNSRGGNA